MKKRPFDFRTFICVAIVAAGTYVLTDSWLIAAGVTALLYILDSLLYVWAEKKNRQYYGNKENENGETD